MLKKGNRGFTILEIVIVIILMGIIGIIAAPSVGLIRKQEVKKLAKEMCLDLTTQRIKAMSKGSDYSYLVALTDDGALGHFYDYKLSFLNKTLGSTPTDIEKEKRSNSKNIQITMERLDETGKVIPSSPPLESIQFDSYGYMMDTAASPQDIYELTIYIKYDDAQSTIDFYGITGNYTITND